MKKVLVYLALALIMIVPIEASDYFCSKKVIDKVEAHTMIVAGWFLDEYGEYRVKFGAGGVLEDNYGITACHVIKDEYYNLDKVWIALKGIDHWVEASVVAMGHSFPELDDYAILKMKEDLGLPGLKIAKKPLRLLQKVLFAGSPGGLAYFVRGGYVSMMEYYIDMNSYNSLKLVQEDFPSLAVYVGYPGDSGGIITNTKGEIQSLMFWGERGKAFVFGNPVSEIWKFLEKNNLAHLRDGKVKKKKKKIQSKQIDSEFRQEFTKWIYSPEVQSFFASYKMRYPEAYQELLTFLKSQVQ